MSEHFPMRAESVPSLEAVWVLGLGVWLLTCSESVLEWSRFSHWCLTLPTLTLPPHRAQPKSRSQESPMQPFLLNRSFLRLGPGSPRKEGHQLYPEAVGMVSKMQA